jgi:tRNA-intron endonuclease
MSQDLTESDSKDSEFAFVVEGIIDNNENIVIESLKQQNQLLNKGFGEKIKDIYILENYEGLFLLYSKKLILKKKKKILDFSSFLKMLLKLDQSIFTKFIIYRDLRTRGYIAKEGFGFGNDFRVYERGEYFKKPAKYIIFGINEGISVKTKLLYDNIRSIEKMGKEAIIAVIERRGEIIYYKVNLKKFDKNVKLIEK